MKCRIIKFVLFAVAILTTLVASGLPGCVGFTSNQAVEYYNKGKAIQDEGRYDEAIAEFSKAIEIDRNYTNAYVSRGYTYLLKKQYDLAITDYTKAIELDPEYANAYNGRGAAYLYTKQFDLAVSDFTKAIEIDPNFTQAYTNRDYATKMLTSKTLTGEWVNGNPVWGFIMNDQGDPIYDAGSTWTYDVVLKLEETAQNTFTGTMQRTLREIRGPVTTVPEIMQWVGNTETCSVSGTRNGSTVELYFGDLTLHLSLNSDSYGDYLQGDTYFYDTGSPVGQFKGLTDVRPSTGEYITWIYSIFLKRK